jgi:hypothetical protein
VGWPARGSILALYLALAKSYFKETIFSVFEYTVIFEAATNLSIEN